jgi:hypothetical protein
MKGLSDLFETNKLEQLGERMVIVSLEGNTFFLPFWIVIFQVLAINKPSRPHSS